MGDSRDSPDVDPVRVVDRKRSFYLSARESVRGAVNKTGRIAVDGAVTAAGFGLMVFFGGYLVYRALTRERSYEDWERRR